MDSRDEGRSLRSGVARTATKQAARRLGTYLRRLRSGQGWTQSQVAEKVEVDAVTIRRWELGMFSPSLKNSERLAGLYGVGVDDLMSAATLEPPESESHGVPVRGYLGTEARGTGARRDVRDLSGDGVPIPGFIVENHPKAFSLIVRGNALTSDGVHNGDILIVDPDADSEIGSLCIVSIDGTLCATVRISADHYRLRTPTGRSEELDASQLEFVGNVAWHIRRM